VAFGVAAALAVIFGALAYRLILAPAARLETRSPVRFAIPEPKEAPFSTNIVEPLQAISPDGQRIVFRGQRQGQLPALWLRSLDNLDAKELAGTEGATQPFWSPDSRFCRILRRRQAEKDRHARRTLPKRSPTRAPKAAPGVQTVRFFSARSAAA
jgi:hypothetical protein